MNTLANTAESEELALLRSATLGEYDIAGPIGHGGMATVYLGHDLALDRKVAIKVMAAAISSSREMVERFKREARTSAALSHPNIMPIYAVRQADPLLYFVMKLIEGRPLDSIVKELGPLPIPMVQAIIGQVAEALGYAHRRGVVHRDVKPANILIDDEGWCVVTDFGIAKVADTDGLTTTGTMVGTPTYMSPEQCLTAEVSGASDQYALGVVAYEMLTGRAPFPDGSMMSVMYAHVHTSIPPIEALRPDCPEALRHAVMRMLAKLPEERWPSVEEAAAAVGSQPLAYDDPTRSQMITLARTGPAVRGADGRRTPRSPVPRARTPIPAAATTAPGMQQLEVPGGRPWGGYLVGGGAALLVSAAIFFAPWRRPTFAAGGDTSTAASARGAARAPAAASVSASVGAPGTDAGPAPASVAVPVPAAKGTAAGPPSIGASRAGGVKPASAPLGAAAGPSAAPVRRTPPVAVVSVESDEPDADIRQLSASAPMGGSPLLNSSRAAGVAPLVRAALERTIRGYAQALAGGDADEARRLFPAMTDDRYRQLAALFAEDKRLVVQWRIGEIAVRGKQATAHVAGTATLVAPQGRADGEKMDQRVILERAGAEWRILQIAP